MSRTAFQGDAKLPFCIPVHWTDPTTHENWLAYPRLGNDARGYHCINVTQGARGDLCRDYVATVDDFGQLVPVGKPYPVWVNSIGQLGQPRGAA